MQPYYCASMHAIVVSKLKIPMAIYAQDLTISVLIFKVVWSDPDDVIRNKSNGIINK